MTLWICDISYFWAFVLYWIIVCFAFVSTLCALFFHVHTCVTVFLMYVFWWIVCHLHKQQKYILFHIIRAWERHHSHLSNLFLKRPFLSRQKKNWTSFQLLNFLIIENRTSEQFLSSFISAFLSKAVNMQQTQFSKAVLTFFIASCLGLNIQKSFLRIKMEWLFVMLAIRCILLLTPYIFDNWITGFIFIIHIPFSRCRNLHTLTSVC